MWHGFAQANDEGNRWADTEEFDFGGYFDDLWEYSPGPWNP